MARKPPYSITETLAQVVAPNFSAGIVLWDDVVVEAAPIIKRRMMRWTRAQVRAYCAAKGWKVHVVHELKRTHPRAP